MADHIDDLKDALSHKLLGSPYDPKGPTPEHNFIRKMAEVVSASDAGDMTPPEFRAILANNPVPGFDWNLWLADRVADGTYDNSVFDTYDD